MPIKHSKCPLCGGSTTVAFAAKDAERSEWTIARCEACGVGFMNPMLEGAELDPYYGGEFYGPGHKRFSGGAEGLIPMFRRARAARVSRLLPSGGSVLDVGCGRGLMLAELAKRGYKCYGIERSDDAANASREAGITVFTCDIADAPIERGSLDAVTYWHSLEHIGDPSASIEAAAALLKTGGWILIQVPNFDSWQARMSRGSWFHLDPPRHLWHFNTKSLDALLTRRGMTREKTKFLSIEYDPFGWAQSAMNLAGLEHNLLYSLMMKREGKEIAASGIERLAARIGGALLLPPSFVMCFLSLPFGAGAVVEVCYRKK